MKLKDKFDKSLYLPKILLLASGIQVENNNFNFILDNLINHWLFYFNILWLYVDVVGEIFWIIEGIQLKKKFEEITFVVPCTTICILGTVKAGPLFLRKATLISIIRVLRNIHPKFSEEDIADTGPKIDVENNGLLKSEKEISNDAMGHLNKIMTFFTYMSIPVFATFCLIPILSMALDMYMTGQTKIKFPFFVNYGFDSSQKYVWPLMYFHQVYSNNFYLAVYQKNLTVYILTVIVLLNVIAADTLFYAFCNYIQMHFRLLRIKIENLICEGYQGSSSDELKHRLREVVMRHQELNDLVEQIEQLYSYSTLFNFVTSSFLICLSVFNVTSVQEVRVMASFAAFLFMSLSQISIFCYGGDMIMQSSKDISAAVYMSRWYLADEEFKKSMFIVLSRAQRPCKLTAAGFADLNLSAFATVLRRSWSYLALLKTMCD